eukprot:c17578_g1_i1.p1 GENE.c17578_g1_i1~~c17578_g1_i1.p1  ORF type:complete len:481 (+),score=174.15 c17578_g1_i1:25-1443(+)
MESDVPFSPHDSLISTKVATLIMVFFIIFSALIAAIPDDDQFTTVDSTVMINAGDTAWVIVASAMVMLMTPGLAFFYGGMVRSKNVLTTLMQSYICLGLITILWIIYGFSLCFGESKGGVIGNPHTYFFYKNVGATPDPAFATTIPLTLFSLFQLFFAVITPALISGSFSERIKFTSYVVVVILWFTIVYCPLAHITWHPNGILRQWGVLDFAGGTVVHMSSGVSAFVGAKVIGPRADDKSAHQPAQIPFVLLGTAMLWFGWIGFNGGSALGASALAVQAFLTTNTAAATGMLTWLLMDAIRGRKPKPIEASCGAVVGLVLVTPACGFVTVGGAMCLTLIGTIVSNTFTTLSRNSKTDDALDVFACHGVGGIMGMLLTGCFAKTTINSVGMDGLFYGGTTLIWRHIVSIIGLVSYIAIVSFLIFKGVDLTLGLRVSKEVEHAGADTQHMSMLNLEPKALKKPPAKVAVTDDL